MDVAAPKPKSRGSAIIFAKFKLSPSKVKNDKENNKAATKLINTIKTSLVLISECNDDK